MSNVQLDTIELIKTINTRVSRLEARQFDLIDCTIQIYSALIKLEENIEFESKQSLKREIEKIKNNLASVLTKGEAGSIE